jgi:hypothetical protein
LAALLTIPACLEDLETSGGAPLDAPTGLTATAAGAAIDLAWTDASTGETGFRVEIAPVPIASDADITEFATVPADATAYSYPAGPNVTRYFRVAAFTATSQSPWSNVASATTADLPPAPGNFTAHVGPVSDVDVLLGWGDLPNETAYQIERSEGGGSWVAVATLGANATAYTDEGTAYDREYRYRVRGTNAAGAGAWSEVATVQTRTTSWSTYSLSQPSADVSWFPSIAVASAGNARVSHYDATWGDVLFSQFTGSALTAHANSPINPGFPDSLGYTGTSLALDGAGAPHLVANDVFNEGIYYLTSPGWPWTAELIAASSDSDRARIALAPGGVPHVVYQQGTNLHHAVRTGPNAWSSELVASNAPDHFAFAIDGLGTLHVVYRRPAGPAHELVHTSQSGGGGWTPSVVPTNGSPEHVSAACDGSGNVHVAYNQTTTWGLSYATNAGGSWAGETVHLTRGGSWGRFNSIAVNPSTGRVHVSYSDMLYDNLRYAWKDPGGAWQLRLLDGVGVVGRGTSLGLDPAGGVYIAYSDATNGDLKLTRD